MRGGAGGAACSTTTTLTTPTATIPPIGQARYPIKHIIIIMQENRSFDSYFGTYPDADGIPMQNGVPTVCVNDPKTSQCVKPFHDPLDLNHGGPHGQVDAFADIDNAKMDGFIAQEEAAFHKVCTDNFDPECSSNTAQPDVMGWHDAREIPNYWSYAEHFVLQDHMFEPNASWSLPAHLFMVSAWSAKCTTPGDPMSCRNALQAPALVPELQNNTADFAWTDLTYLLHKYNVSWGYYLD